MWLTSTPPPIPEAVKELLVDSGVLSDGVYQVDLIIQSKGENPFLLRLLGPTQLVKAQQYFFSVKGTQGHLFVRTVSGDRLQVLSSTTGLSESSVSISINPQPRPRKFLWWNIWGA
jgi:hypothetical protein